MRPASITPSTWTTSGPGGSREGSKLGRGKITPAEIQKYLLLLEETLRRIAAVTKGQDEERLRLPPDGKHWSVVEILAHLRACSDLWSHSIFAMLVEETPSLPVLDERRWAKAKGYASLPFSVSFQTFTLEREDLLHVLSALRADGVPFSTAVNPDPWPV